MFSQSSIKPNVHSTKTLDRRVTEVNGFLLALGKKIAVAHGPHFLGLPVFAANNVLKFTLYILSRNDSSLANFEFVNIVQKTTTQSNLVTTQLYIISNI